MHNDYYVYLHRRKTDNEVFYVGKGRCIVLESDTQGQLVKEYLDMLAEQEYYLQQQYED